MNNNESSKNNSQSENLVNKEKEIKIAIQKDVNKLLKNNNQNIVIDIPEVEKNKKVEINNNKKNVNSGVNKNFNTTIKKENKNVIGNKNPKNINKEPNKQTNNKYKNNNNEYKKESTNIIPATNNKPAIRANMDMVQTNKGKLRIIPLGGLNEVGKNITAFEYENEIIIVDCGLKFPEDDMLGVDLVIPDFTFLEKNASKIKALVITHGHEDHIGAIPYFLKKINVPIYATRLTLGLISNKLDEHRLTKTTKLHCIEAGQMIEFTNMKVEFIKTTHSIADTIAVAIHTPLGIIVHTSDFKIDYTPIDGKQMDFARFAELGNQGVLLLLSDSTNVERPGYTMSESSVGEVFDKIFIGTTKRILVATFASNIHRVQQIINSAVKTNRKVAIVGRSMLNVISVAKELGYITIPEGTLIEIDKISMYNPEQLVIITTGSQGEPMSALSRMSTGEHKKVEITSGDLVILSSSPIPGNEKSIGRVMDELQKLGAEVIYNQLADVHVSGHACQEELKLMLSLVKPKYFMPVHGEYRFLKHHGEIAKSVGVNPNNVFILSNGKTLEVTKDDVKIGAQVQSGVVLVDGLGVGDVGNIVLRDRQLLSENGMMVVVMTLEGKTGKIVAGPDIITRGFVYVRESEGLMEEIKEVAKKELTRCEENQIKEWSLIKANVKDALCDYIYSKTKREPMILPIIMEV